MITFIGCVESGALEAQALLFCSSLRQFGGAYAQSRVVFYAPRVGHLPSKQTQHELQSLGAELNCTPLNLHHADYAIGNKIFACAHAESTLAEEVLVFVDSDTIITGEPAELDLPEHVHAAVRPVDQRNRGSRGEGDKHDVYWQRLYEFTNVTTDTWVNTVVDGERIRAYYNAGLIAVRREHGLFNAWHEAFLTLMRAQHIPAHGINNLDQLALATVLSKHPDRTRELDDRYNYPMGKRPILPQPLAAAQLSDLRHVHYHRWFQKPDFLRLTRPKLNPNDVVYRWLEARLPLHPTIDTPMRYLDRLAE